MRDTHISLAHGNGGRFMRELIEDLFARHLANPGLDVDADAVSLDLPDAQEIMFTTDGFTVQPLEFPGGNIGSLAVHGTINDLAVSGAIPRYLSLNAFIEEGLETSILERIVKGMAAACLESDVRIMAGDTKVLRRGEGGGVYLATTGVGVRPRGLRLGLQRIRPGDKILVSGPVGDHGVSVMLAREQFGMRGDLASDAASVLPLTQALVGMSGLRFMRDPTRGGLATVCHEISRVARVRVVLHQASIPVRDPVVSVCEILGYDPLFLACEGRVVAVVGPEQAEEALTAWRQQTSGRDAAVVGEIDNGPRQVEMVTELGGSRLLQELEDDPLPRIC
jgi:hydrogenase expression/formation protein HypE